MYDNKLETRIQEIYTFLSNVFNKTASGSNEPIYDTIADIIAFIPKEEIIGSKHDYIYNKCYELVRGTTDEIAFISALDRVFNCLLKE